MVEKGYYENESLSLAWDHMEVCQVALFITTIFDQLKVYSTYFVSTIFDYQFS